VLYWGHALLISTVAFLNKENIRYADVFVSVHKIQFSANIASHLAMGTCCNGVVETISFIIAKL
jgi:hypothetical protein